MRAEDPPGTGSLAPGAACRRLILILAVLLASGAASAETPRPSAEAEAPSDPGEAPPDGEEAAGARAARPEGSEVPPPEATAAPPEGSEVPPPEASAAPPEGSAAAPEPAEEVQPPLEPEPVDALAGGGLGERTEGVEEIVVTGVRLEDTLQAAPVSATTFGGEELRSLRIEDVQDLAAYTANLEVNTKTAASNPNLFIRGIGLKDYNANAAGAVAVYQDDINIALPALQLGQLFDVGSVQVLRGPQGSTRGRNATAGAIYINSVQPGDEFDFNSSFTYGNYNNIQAEGGITVPLIDGVLSSRIAFTANFRDGTTENACARWNPQNHPEFQDTVRPNGLVDSFLVNRDTIQAEYQKDLIAGRAAGMADEDIFSVENYGIQQTGVQGRQARIRAAADEIIAAGLEPVAKRLTVDGVCMVSSTGPGTIVTPLGEDALNAAGTYQTRGGTPQFEDFQGLKTDINNVHDWAGRGILRLTPPPEGALQPFAGSEWTLNLHGSQNASDSYHLQMLGADVVVTGGFREWQQEDFSERIAADLTHGRFEGTRRVDGLEPALNGQYPGEGGDDPFVGWYNQDGQELLDTWGVALKGFWEVGDSINVTSLTGWEWYQRVVEDEGDATPLAVYPAVYDDASYEVSQELRAEGTWDRLRWTAGLYFLYTQLDALNRFPSVRVLRIDQTFDQRLLSGAPYLGAAYLLTDELSLEGGLRYNVENKTFQLESKSVALESGEQNPEIRDQEEEKTWTGLTGDLTLAYTPAWSVLERMRSDSLSLYTKYTRGMKGGHYNAALSIRRSAALPRIEVVDPEYIHAVEVGLKSSWFEDRLTLNMAGFRYWYKDLQVFDVQNGKGELPYPKLENADALVLGAEVDLEARPLPGLFVQTSFGFLDTAFEDFVVTKVVSLGSRGEPIEQTFDYKGNPLIAAPRFSLSSIVEQTIPLFGWGFLVPQYSFSYRSKQYLDPQQLDPISQDPYWVHSARLAYRTPDERIEVAGWVENFLDEPYKIDAFDLTREYNSITEVWSDPRTFGITLSYSW
jgi:outer membrane receptor protein involved in Fe transport